MSSTGYACAYTSAHNPCLRAGEGELFLYSKLQQIAYHESSHALAALRQSIPFTKVHLLTCKGEEGTLGGFVEFPTGTMDPIARVMPETALLIILAGMAADKIMRPHRSYLVNMIGSGAGDWDEAKFVASRVNQSSYRSPAHHAFSILRTSARRFVIEEWHNIVRIGDALIASPDRKLSYEQCSSLLGAECEQVAA